MATKVVARNKVDKKFTWNAESVFESHDAWEKEVDQILEDIAKVKIFQGRLSEGPSTLLDGTNAVYELLSRAGTAAMYAEFLYSVDTTD